MDTESWSAAVERTVSALESSKARVAARSAEYLRTDDGTEIRLDRLRTVEPT